MERIAHLNEQADLVEAHAHQLPPNDIRGWAASMNDAIRFRREALDLDAATAPTENPMTEPS